MMKPFLAALLTALAVLAGGPLATFARGTAAAVKDAKARAQHFTRCIEARQWGENRKPTTENRNTTVDRKLERRRSAEELDMRTLKRPNSIYYQRLLCHHLNISFIHMYVNDVGVC